MDEDTISWEDSGNPFLDKIIAEYLQALERGETPDQEAILEKYAEFREELEEFFIAFDGAQEAVRPEHLQSTVDGQSPTTPFASRPKQIGPYKLIKPLGHGGMGEVWIAWHEQLDRKVALKLILKGKVAAGPLLERFKAESKALAEMNHRNIATVFDAGESEQGQPYFVMEYVDGTTLDAYCDQAKCTVEERLDLFLQITEGVQHAHDKGIVHRDLKPQNVLVTMDGERPVAKIIDFGLAKAFGDVPESSVSRSRSHALTSYGMILGTPLYMAPEQANFGSEKIDRSADIYSLGVILYELLTGRRPFEMEELEAAAIEELLRIIREVEPPRPSARLSSADGIPSYAAYRSTDPKKLLMIAKELDWVVMKSLEKERSRRYASAEHLGGEVQRFLLGMPLEAHPPSLAYRTRKFIKRKRIALSIGAVALVLCVALGWFAWDASQARKNETEFAGKLESETQARLATEKEKESLQQDFSETENALVRETFRNVLLECESIIKAHERGWKRKVDEELEQFNDWNDLSLAEQQELERIRTKQLLGTDIGTESFSMQQYRSFPMFFHPNKPWLIVASSRPPLLTLVGEIVVYSTEDGARLFSIQTRGRNVFDPREWGTRTLGLVENDLLFAGTRDGAFLSFALNSEGNVTREDSRFSRSTYGAPSHCYFSDENVLLIAGQFEKGKWGIESRQRPGNELIASVEIPAGHFLNCGRHGVLVSNPQGTLDLLDPTNLETRRTLPFPANTKIAHWGDLLAAPVNGGISMYSLLLEEQVAKFEGPQIPTSEGAFRFSPDGSLIAVADMPGSRILFWTVADGQFLMELPIPESDDVTRDFAFSPDGSKIAVSNGDNVFVHPILRPATRSVVAASSPVMTFDYSPATDRVFTISGSPSSRKGFVEVFDFSGTDSKKVLEKAFMGLPVLFDPGIVAFDDTFAITEGVAQGEGKDNWDGRISAFSFEDWEKPLWSQEVKRSLFLEGLGNRVLSTSLISPLGSKAASIWTRSIAGEEATSWTKADHIAFGNGSAYHVAIPVGNEIWLGDEKGVVTIVEWGDTPELVRHKVVSKTAIRCGTYLPAEKKVVFGTDAGELIYLNADSSELRVQHTLRNSTLACTQVLQIGESVATLDKDSLRIWSPEHRLIHQIDLSIEQIESSGRNSLLLKRKGSFMIEELSLDQIGAQRVE